MGEFGNFGCQRDRGQEVNPAGGLENSGSPRSFQSLLDLPHECAALHPEHCAGAGRAGAGFRVLLTPRSAECPHQGRDVLWGVPRGDLTLSVMQMLIVAIVLS